MYIRFDSHCSKAFLVYFICLSILFRPVFAHASTNLGGWSLGNPVVNGASAIVDATKNALINGKNVVKTGTAIIAPNAAEVAKVLGKGVAGVALSVAVQQLLGSVDWVLDPENNQIQYSEKIENLPFLYGSSSYKVKVIYSQQEACARIAAEIGRRTQMSTSFNSISKEGYCVFNYGGGQSTASMEVAVNPNYDPNAKPEQKTIPLPTVAQQVITNAESGDSDAKVAIGSAVADIISQAESDTTKARPIVNQLEASATTATNETATAESTTTTTTTDTTTNTTTNTTTTNNIALNFPVFCGWAPLVCESAQSVIALATTFQDFLKEDEITTKYEIPEIKDPDLSIAVSNHIQFSSQCPLDRQIPLSIGGHTLNLVISYQPLCTVAEQFRPAVILMSYLAGAFIITNTGRRAETGD